MPNPLKILLVQLAANGDCLYVTTIAKQIKEIDYPGCHLTWMIGSRCAQVLKNNPYIDTIIEIPLSSSKKETTKERNRIPVHVAEATRQNKFDQIFITDYTKQNLKHWYGNIRPSLFRSYPHELKINPQPLIFLTDEEIEQVETFCQEHAINDQSYNILFECSPLSSQSLMNFETAKQIAEEVTAKNKNIKFILSSSQGFESHNPNIIDGSKVSWRGNAELANYCNLLVGCSSGISWLCTSNWTKKMPFIQLINPGYAFGKLTASMKSDFEYFGISTSELLELYNPFNEIIKDSIFAASEGRFREAKKKYDQKADGSLPYLAMKTPKITLSKKLRGFIARRITKRTT